MNTEMASTGYSLLSRMAAASIWLPSPSQVRLMRTHCVSASISNKPYTTGMLWYSAVKSTSVLHPHHVAARRIPIAAIRSDLWGLCMGQKYGQGRAGLQGQQEFQGVHPIGVIQQRRTLPLSHGHVTQPRICHGFTPRAIVA